MKVKIVPKECEGEDKKFEGFVELSPLGFDEAMEAIANIGDLKALQTEGEQTGKLKAVIAMVKVSKDKYQKVQIKRLSDGKEYKSIDDLWYDRSCQGILTDVATQLFNGGESLGN